MASYRIHQSLVEKPLKIEKYMPLRGDKVTETNKVVWGSTPEEAKANYDKIMAAHKVKMN